VGRGSQGGRSKLIAIATFAVIALIAVLFSPWHAIAVVGGCLLLLLLPLPTILTVLVASVVYLSIQLFKRIRRNGIRRLPGPRS
jgi:hypothetical protein